ncbi:MAG TPA: hypothetical protein VKA54_05415 [Gemmatimonadaceae bacterium]|nr:hypothetical protein [Gemmatimonadaceae bacterium]
MTDDRDLRDVRDPSLRDRPAQPASRELSTADLAIAADRNAGGSTTDLERNIGDREVERMRAGAAPADVSATRDTPLLAPEVVTKLQSEWTDIQAGFVDEPRRAVERADGLVADAIKRLAETFANERGQLEGQWDRGGDVSTEDLRQALQRYRSFFSRLLSV